MIQMTMFGQIPSDDEAKYTRKIETPVYEPRHAQPHLLQLCDQTKTAALIREIDGTDLSELEKVFLRAAAWRHAVFHYERIADYYAHALPAMQRLMERSALVIIDFESAIERGFVRLSDDIRTQYLEEYPVDADAS